MVPFIESLAIGITVCMVWEIVRYFLQMLVLWIKKN